MKHPVTVDLLKRMARRAHQEQLTFLAAAVSYYALVSVIPLLLLALAVASTLNQEAFASAVTGFAATYLSPELRPAVQDLAGSLTRGRGVAAGAAVLFLLWGGMKVFVALDRAFSQVYGSKQPESTVHKLRDAATALLSVGLVIAVSVLWGGVLEWYSGPGAAAAGTMFLVAALAAALTPLYLLFPDVEVGVWNAVPGAVFAAATITVLRLLFDLYTAMVSGYGAYGVLGGFLLLATWFYLAANAVLLGAVINAELT